MTTELFGENSKNYVQNAPLYPFRYYQSYKAVKESDDIPHDEKMKALGWLEGAMSTSAENLPDVLEDTFVAVDTSGSMSASVSSDSDLECVEIASLFGALVYGRGADLGAFASEVQEFHGDRRDSIPTLMKEIQDMPVGGGTSGYLIPKALRENERDRYNQVIVFTDMQMWGGNLYNSGQSFRDEWHSYREEVNPDVSLYLIDLNSYGDLVTPENEEAVYQLSGWSENVVDYVDKMEHVDGMVREIESVEPSQTTTDSDNGGD